MSHTNIRPLLDRTGLSSQDCDGVPCGSATLNRDVSCAMWKRAALGAAMLAAIGTTSVSADGPGPSVSRTAITSAHISHLKSTLRLTPQQEHHWPPVETALRNLTRLTEEDTSKGFAQRLGAHASAAVTNAARIRRVWAAARPLIRSLDAQQKRDAMSLARSLGISHWAY
jgi:hypothetical protein